MPDMRYLGLWRWITGHGELFGYRVDSCRGDAVSEFEAGEASLEPVMESSDELASLVGHFDPGNTPVMLIGGAFDEISFRYSIDEAGHVGLVAAQCVGELTEGRALVFYEAQELGLLRGKADVPASCCIDPINAEEEAKQRVHPRVVGCVAGDVHTLNTIRIS